MNIVSQLIRQAGPVGLYQLAQRMTAGVPKILMYHRFSEQAEPGCTSRASFEQQLDYLQRNHTVTTLQDIVSAADNGKGLPRNAVVLTIDDGYEDFYSVAFPLLKQFDLPATLFVTTGFVNGEQWLWPDKVDWLLHNAGVIPEAIQLGDVSLAAGPLDAGLRARYWGLLIHHLLKVTDEEKQQLINMLAARLGLTLPQLAPHQYRACGWEQLREMQDQGIEIGGHTVTHPSLGRVTAAQAREEINACKQMLEQQLGSRPRPFCYPNGTVSDFNAEVMQLVQDSGFFCAVAAFDDCRVFDQRFAMRRFPCGDNMFQFYKCVSGMQHLGNRFRNKVMG